MTVWARRVGAGAAVLLVGLGAFVVAGAVLEGPSLPDLRFVQDVPSDVRVETEATWTRFQRTFDGRLACIGDVSVSLERAVDDGDARYVASGALIEIQIPTTPARYRESLAHELAHHLERTCDEFGTLRSALLPLLARPGDGWSDGPTWEQTASERFAEAVVEVVNGERMRHTDRVIVDPGVVAAIERWGSARSTDG